MLQIPEIESSRSHNTRRTTRDNIVKGLCGKHNSNCFLPYASKKNGLTGFCKSYINAIKSTHVHVSTRNEMSPPARSECASEKLVIDVNKLSVPMTK